MRSSQRLDRIVKLVEDSGFVSVTDLSKACNVTEVTIRRDLQHLENEQRLRRTHGGAFAALLERRTAGLPAVQEKVLQLLYEGKSDAEIAHALGGKSALT